MKVLSPSRITARVTIGSGKVIDIEREVELGGPLHSKGVLILSGFLASHYVTDRPLSLSATLVFPLYDGGIYLRTDYSWMDDHLTTSATTVADHQIQDREDLNAKLGWRNDNWNLSVWGKNLTDDEYAAFTASTFPVTSMDAYWLAPPLTYGATVRYSF